MRAILLLTGLLLATTLGLAQDNLPYPQGKAFPLGLYSIGSVEEMTKEKPWGWNISHTYGMKPEFLDVSKQGGMLPLVHLDEGLEAQVKQSIRDLAARGPVGWWDFPEEMRHWRKDEFDIVKNYAAWTRECDPGKRPNFMYLPNHYTADAVAKYVPYLDIIGVGAYTEYAHMPRAWVRWRMEETIKGIELAGAKIGANYLQGEKVPIGIPMLFYNPDVMDVISPGEAYHDFYSCLAAGARGMLIFSYWHKRDQGMLHASYDAYARAAGEVSGPVGLGQALLFGEELKVACEVTKGDARTWSFQVTNVPQPVSFPSVNARAVRYQGKVYVVAVNSSEDAVEAKLTGLPAGLKLLTTPFEKQLDEQKKPTDKPRELRVAEGTVADSFGWLGVHVYVGE